MRKTMFLIVSSMLMVTPTRAENHVVPMINFMDDCKTIEKELDNFLLNLGTLFASHRNQRLAVMNIDRRAYDFNTQMAVRWTTIYTAKCPVKKQ